MTQVLSSVDNIRFDIEDALDKQIYATLSLPFPGIDSKFIFFLRLNFVLCVQVY